MGENLAGRTEGFSTADVGGHQLVGVWSEFTHSFHKNKKTSLASTFATPSVPLW